MHFEHYSDEALESAVKQALGKLCLDENQNPIGKIVNAVRIEGTNIIELEVKYL